MADQREGGAYAVSYTHLEDTREHIMSFEARSFYEAIGDPARNREKVEELCALACEVSGAMETIRRQAGIRFPSDIQD